MFRTCVCRPLVYKVGPFRFRISRSRRSEHWPAASGRQSLSPSELTQKCVSGSSDIEFCQNRIGGCRFHTYDLQVAKNMRDTGKSCVMLYLGTNRPPNPKLRDTPKKLRDTDKTCVIRARLTSLITECVFFHKILNQ